MRYILMMNTPKGPYQHQNWPEQAWQDHLAYWDKLNAQLKASGEYVSVEALTAPDQAKLIRADKDGRPVTDGIFPEAKEFLAGYWIVEVANAERAYAIAAQASAAPGPDGKPLNMLLEVREVSKYFGNVVALKDISVGVGEGEVACVLGDNGAGKSTFIKILSGVHRHDEGELLVEGEPTHFW